MPPTEEYQSFLPRCRWVKSSIRRWTASRFIRPSSPTTFTSSTATAVSRARYSRSSRRSCPRLLNPRHHLPMTNALFDDVRQAIHGLDAAVSKVFDLLRDLDDLAVVLAHLGEPRILHLLQTLPNDDPRPCEAKDHEAIDAEFLDQAVSAHGSISTSRRRGKRIR